MKRNILLSLLCLCLLIAPRAAGATAFGDFKNNAVSATLKPFALDLGGVLGGTEFHSARALGLPGFDVGLVATVQSRPDTNDLILRAPGVQRFGIPMLQAEVGLPLNFDLIAHGMTAQGARVFGGGIRYGIHKAGVVSILPDVAVSAFADRLNHAAFSATHYGLNAVASFHFPILHPYLGAGYDLTQVKAGSSVVPGVSGTSAWARGTRITGGVDISPLPLIHIYGAYTILHGISGVDLGLGARF